MGLKSLVYSNSIPGNVIHVPVRGSLSIAIAIVTILSATVPLPCISVTTIAVVGVSFWLWLGGSLAIAVFVSGVVGPIIAAIVIGGWCRVGRCLLFEGDAKQKQAHQENKVEPHAVLLGP